MDFDFGALQTFDLKTAKKLWSRKVYVYPIKNDNMQKNKIDC